MPYGTGELYGCGHMASASVGTQFLIAVPPTEDSTSPTGTAPPPSDAHRERPVYQHVAENPPQLAAPAQLPRRAHAIAGRGRSTCGAGAALPAA